MMVKERWVGYCFIDYLYWTAGLSLYNEPIHEIDFVYYVRLSTTPALFMLS